MGDNCAYLTWLLILWYLESRTSQNEYDYTKTFRRFRPMAHFYLWLSTQLEKTLYNAYMAYIMQSVETVLIQLYMETGLLKTKPLSYKMLY